MGTVSVHKTSGDLDLGVQFALLDRSRGLKPPPLVKPIIKTFNCLLITDNYLRVVWLDATVVPMLGMGFIKGAELRQLLNQSRQLR